MLFKLTKSHRYWWPVTVRIPDPENAGKIIEQKLRVQFEPKDREAMLSAQEEAAQLTTLRELTNHEIHEALDIIKDWGDVIGDEGSPIPFNQERLIEALRQPWFRAGIQRALEESLNGKAVLGN